MGAGFRVLSLSGSSPSFAIVRGVKFSMTMSAQRTSAPATSEAPSALRFKVTLHLSLFQRLKQPERFGPGMLSRYGGRCEPEPPGGRRGSTRHGGAPRSARDVVL